MYFVAGATSNFVYAGVAGEDKLIVVMHVGLPVALHLAAKHNSATGKPKKAKNPTVWPKTVVAIEKTIRLQKTWMILLQPPPLIGLWCLRTGQIW